MAENGTPNPAAGDSGKTPQAQTNAGSQPGNKDAEKAAAEAQKAAEDAQKARDKADDAALSPEERKARDAERKAGDARSRAAQAATETPREGDTVASANMMQMGERVDGEMSAGDHLAQKFGNDPANPKPAKHIPADYDGPTIRLSMKTPDLDRPRYTDVHPDMEGDYLRAGWNRA